MVLKKQASMIGGSKPMDEKYWKDLVSTALRVFQSKGNLIYYY